MAKKDPETLTEGERTTIDGWLFVAGENVTATKQFAAQDIKDVSGRDLQDALACAREVDRIVGARVAGQREQNEAIADRLHAEADAVATAI